MTRCYSDIESYCETPITHGSYKYAEEAEVILWSYAFDDQPVKLWDATKDKIMPTDLKKATEDPCVTFVFHNGGGFDRVVIEKALGIRIPPERIHDTMARAFSHGFPGALDVICDIMQVPESKAKDKDGKKLIQLFCVPKRFEPKTKRKDFDTKGAFNFAAERERIAYEKSDKKKATRLSHPLEWDRFCSYAMRDIEAMRFIDKNMPLRNYTGTEYALWCLDQKINERGIKVDLDLANAAIRAVKRAQEKLAARTSDLTLGDVNATTQRDELLRHILEAYGVELPDMQASTLEHRMNDPELPPEVKELLANRLQASSNSTAKYGKFITHVSSDGRIRGTLQFSGAQRSKRWAGRAVQLHNMPRPDMSQEDIGFGIECIKNDCEDLFFDDVMQLGRNAIRGCLIADEGKKLCVSDLANIEGRDAAWLAGEERKLKVYRDFDAGIGPDSYKKSYADTFRISYKDVDKNQRSVGKVMELMLQFAGGVGAFITGAATYGIDLEDMARRALPEIHPDVIRQAEAWWQKCVTEKRTLGLTRDVFVACDALKRMWRTNHPHIESMWEEMENAARNAIDSKGKTIKCRKLGFLRTGNWLWMVLPSGDYLSYPAPRIGDGNEISFMGMHPYTKKWGRIKTYGGKFFENSCQSIARNVMAHNMLNHVEPAGYDLLLTVHDETIAEAPDNDSYSARELSRLLSIVPPWAEGLPLAAEGYESQRYRKE